MKKKDRARLDVLINMIMEDPSRLDGILEDNKDIRKKLEPILSAAALLAGIRHPEMMPDLKQSYRQFAYIDNPKAPGNHWGNMAV